VFWPLVEFSLSFIHFSEELECVVGAVRSAGSGSTSLVQQRKADRLNINRLEGRLFRILSFFLHIQRNVGL
jgi:hypothetical protein